MLLMKQGEQGWLLAGGGGNHEFARCFFFDDGKGGGSRYLVGLGGSNRLGVYALEHVAVDETGAHFSWSQGRKSHIPRDWFQATWV